MIGDDRVRFCPQCKLNVYNFSAMPETEIQRLIARRDGRLCARWYRRADGMILTTDCPVGFRAKVKRVSKVAGAALAALLGASPLAAQKQTQPASPSLVQIQNPLTDNRASLTVTVSDQSGAVIPLAEVEVIDESGGQVLKGKTDGKGVFSAAGLEAGSYTVRASALNFQAAEVVHVRLPTAESKELRLTPHVAVQGGVMVVAEDPPELLPDSSLPATIPLTPKTPPASNLNFFHRLLRKLHENGQ